MQKLIVHIESDPVHSFRLTGDEVCKFREKALEDARDLYLEYYDEVYRKLMSKDFNPLWTPDTKSDNDVDFKDDFWRVSYFLFNVCLLRILRKEYDLEVNDKTRSEFETQKYLYKFLNKEGIALKKLHKKESFINKNAIKKFVLSSIRIFPRAIQNLQKEFRKKFLLKRKPVENNKTGRNTLYLFVEPVGEMSFVNWRYSKLLKEYKEKGNNIVIVSTIDFKNSEQQEYPFINVNRLVSKPELLRVLGTSLFLKLKVMAYVWSESFKTNNDVAFEYFLKNVPRSFFYPVRENCGFDKLFKTFGAGLLVIKGPVLNKGGAMQIYNARKHGIRTLIIAGRVLTSTRLSNQIVKSHFDERFPKIYPHSMVVEDQISFETIQKQTLNIQLYPLGSSVYSLEKTDSGKSNPFRITVALQKKKEIEVMVDPVIAAIKGMDDVVVNLKMHPSFPIYDQLLKKFQKIQNLTILPIETTLSDAIEESDLCITAYSSAALEFIKKGKPVVWLKNVTLNSLFFADLQKKVGITVDDSNELREVIIKMKENTGYYQKERTKQHSQINGLIYSSVDKPDSLSGIINKELKKA